MQVYLQQHDRRLMRAKLVASSHLPAAQLAQYHIVNVLSKDEYARTTRKKRADTRKGLQHSAQPKDVAKKTAPYREGGHAGAASKAELYAEAKKRDIPGRSKMDREQLLEALGRAA